MFKEIFKSWLTLHFPKNLKPKSYNIFVLDTENNFTFFGKKFCTCILHSVYEKAECI